MKFYFLIITLIVPAISLAFTKEAYKQKMLIRKHIMENGRHHTKSSPGFNDDVQDLFPELRLKREILDLPIEGKILTQPWSDDYWPIYKGVLGARYATPAFTELFTWKTAKNYVLENPYTNEATAEFKDKLSPGEKFDLLLTADANNLKLTKAMWAQGERYLDQYEEVEKWMGICHGWAPAAFMVKRPQKAITVKDAQNNDLTFYPSDIKALISLLWASGEFQNNFVGGRCNSKEPEFDEDGRLVATECRDNNPATFHLALANGIGIHQKSFVMDATFDYEVWNQPISSYKMEFFSLSTHETTTNVKDAIVALDKIPEDPFKKHRSPNTKYIVGVHLMVDYIVETTPTHNTIDDPRYDGINTAYYTYDLELDENYQVIGGEWYDEQHPDFLWRPVEHAQAMTFYDYYIMSDPLWNGQAPLNLQYRQLANKAAEYGLPLAYVVNSLVKLSQNNQERIHD